MRRVLSLALSALLFASPAWADAFSSVPPFTGQMAGFITANGQRVQQETVAQRAPVTSDDSTAGYAVGDLWQWNGRVWQCTQNTASDALWVPYNAYALPGDAVGASALFIGGTRRYLNAYSGNLINVTRASDSTTLAIGQLSDGALDAKALEAFCAATTCTVNTVYNQAVAGNDATQTTVANQPAILRRGMTGNAYSIVFDSQYHANITTKYLALASATSGTTNSVSSFVVARHDNAISQVNYISLSGTSGARDLYYEYSGASNKFVANVTGSGFLSFNGKPTTSPEIIGLTSGASTIEYVDNTTGTGGSIGSTAWNGGYIGYAAQDTSHPGYWETPFVGIWGSSLSSAQVTNLYASLYAALNLTPQARDTITCYGDSITEGYGGKYLQTYCRIATDALSLPARVYNVGGFGQQISSQLSVQSTMTSYLTPIAATTARQNILFAFGGTNDYASSVSAAAVESAFQTVTTQARTMGFTKILWATTLPRTTISGAQETQRQAGNTWLRVNYPSYAAGLVDLASDATMGAANANANTNLYIDGTHPTDLGYQYIGNLMSAGIKSIWR